MSYITDVILLFSLGEDVLDGTERDEWPIANEINVWLKTNYDEQLHYLSDAASGGKSFQAVMYAGCFNFFDLDKFIAFLRTLEWVEPELVQLLIKSEEDELFSMPKLKLLPPNE